MKKTRLLITLIILVSLAACTPGLPTAPPPTQAPPTQTAQDPQPTAPGAATEPPAPTDPPVVEPTKTNPAALPTATLTRQPAPSPTAFAPPTATLPQPTATQDTSGIVATAFDFQELIRYGEGGGGGFCEPFGRALPLVSQGPFEGYPWRQDFLMCLIGLPGGELVDLSIIDPQGNETSWTSVRMPTEPYYDPNTLEIYTRLELPGIQTLALVSPDWRIKARSGNLEMEASLFSGDFGGWWQEGQKVITYSRFPTGDKVNPLDPKLRAPFRTGETIYIQGVNFAPNQALPLAIYNGVFDLDFSKKFAVQTDEQGSFEVKLTINADFKDGFNSIVPADFTSPDTEFATDGAFATFQVRNQMPYAACADAPPSRLAVGMRAEMVDDESNNLRYGPSLSDTDSAFDRIHRGERVQVLSGPECGDGFVWWLVLDENSRLVGWTAEGDEDGAWLEPR
jgi:hypothetical protein